jgi:hypothetical protein
MIHPTGWPLHLENVNLVFRESERTRPTIGQTAEGLYL